MVLTGQQILNCSDNIDKNSAYAVSTSTAISTFSQHMFVRLPMSVVYMVPSLTMRFFTYNFLI